MCQSIDIDGSSLCALTSLGKEIFSKSLDLRQLDLISVISKFTVFRESILLYLHKSELPEVEEIILIMNNAELNKKYGESTIARRAQTVLNWVNWVVGQIE